MVDGPAPTPTPGNAKASGHGLTKKVGPLPIWGWAVVIIGSYLLYRYLKDRSAASGTTGLVGGTGTTLGTNNAGSGGGGNTVGTGTTASGTDTTTAQGWLAAAQNALQGLGLDNNTINGALNDYVAGNPLPQSEYNIVSEAIKIIGAAPSSLGNPALAAPTPAAPAPTPTPTPTPTAASSLPPLNPNNFVQKLLYGQWSSADYTKIGSYNNGQYSGYNVSGGAPVYLNVFGGLVQGFQPSTATGDVYVPTSLLPYVSGYPNNAPGQSNYSTQNPSGVTRQAA